MMREKRWKRGREKKREEASDKYSVCEWVRAWMMSECSAV